MAINRLVPNRARRRISYRTLAILAVVLGSLAPTVAAGDKSSGGDEHVVPTGLIVLGTSPSSVSLAWDDVANGTKYVLSVDGKPLLATPQPRATVDRLTCGTAYTFAVATYDNAPPADQATIIASSSPCAAAAATQSSGATAASSLATTSAAAGDTEAPTLPGWLTVREATETSLTMSWSASTDNVAVAGYGLYVNGNRVATTTSTDYVVGSLACGSSYAIAVDAFDAAGNRSQKNERTVATDPCTTASAPTTTTSPTTTTAPTTTAAPPQAQSGDTTAPTIPTWFTLKRNTESSLTVSWHASSDNVAVAGYGLYLNGDRVGTTTTLGYVYASLQCDTSYTIAVDAYDAAGNRSGKNERTVSTDACSSSSSPPPPTTTSPSPTTDTQPPTTPTGLARADSTPTSVTLSWNRSTDNVGVQGYGLYIGGNRVSSSGSTSAYFGALACGTSVTLGVDAFDAAGNRSALAQLTTSTQACPTSTTPPASTLPTSCDRVASPGQGTANALLGSLTSGQVGCLHGGIYTASSSNVLDVSKSNVTLMAYPGENPVLRGLVIVRNGANGVRLANLSIDGPGGSNTIQIYGDDFVLEGSDITNSWRGRSCMMLGDGSAGTADRPVIRNNRFHECGSLSNGNQDHAIYAAHVVNGQISNNTFWDTAGYTVHLYPDAQGTTVSHNTIDGGSPSVRGGVIFGGDSNNASSGNVVEYNVIAYSTTYNIESWWGGPVGNGNVARYNCVYGGGDGNIAPQNGFVATGNVVANPLFEDRSGADYALLATSPCLSLIK
jgi:chitodextrinase